MFIKQKTRQHRRDFEAVMECEHCGNPENLTSGYDDAYYHNSVIPKMKCKKCGKEASKDYKPQATVYPDGLQL